MRKCWSKVHSANKWRFKEAAIVISFILFKKIWVGQVGSGGINGAVKTNLNISEGSERNITKKTSILCYEHQSMNLETYLSFYIWLSKRELIGVWNQVWNESYKMRLICLQVQQKQSRLMSQCQNSKYMVNARQETEKRNNTKVTQGNI